MAERLSHDEIASLMSIKTIEPADGPKDKEKEIGVVDLDKEPEFVDLHKPSECGDSQKNRGGSSGLPAPPEAGQPDRKEEQGTAAKEVDTEDVDLQYEAVNDVVAAMPQRGCEFVGTKFYHRMLKHVLQEEQLQKNGYPRPDPENSNTAKFYTPSPMEKRNLREKVEKNKTICIRCGKHFRVGPNRSYECQEVCIYHERKILTEKNEKGYTIREYFACCMGNVGVEGCKVAEYHVHDSNKWKNRTGYLRTLPCPPVPDGDYGVYAMDTEMVYTEGGLELAHVTVTDCSNEPVYETFVRPDTKVIDYNTRYSGVTAKKMEGVTTTIRDVQEKLCSIINKKTILIGHSLECDLTAVKLIHDTVVDTAVVFPDHRGPWFKMALKTLVTNYLEKTIQDNVGGHDSQEDAISCMQLMQWRVKEDAHKEPPCG